MICFVVPSRTKISYLNEIKNVILNVYCLHFFLFLVYSLQCYSCQKNEGNCLETNSQTKHFVCTEKQVCYMESRFFRSNSSTPFKREPGSLERKCQKPATNMCNINDPRYGPCILNQEANMLACYSCCTSDFCNTHVPMFNKASNRLTIPLTITIMSIFISISFSVL